MDSTEQTSNPESLATVGSFNRAKPTEKGGYFTPYPSMLASANLVKPPSFSFLKETNQPDVSNSQEIEKRYRSMMGEFRYYLYKAEQERMKLKLSPKQLAVLAYLIENGPTKYDDVPVPQSSYSKALLVEASLATRIMVPGYRTVHDIPTIAATPLGAFYFCMAFQTKDLDEALAQWTASQTLATT